MGHEVRLPACPIAVQTCFGSNHDGYGLSCYYPEDECNCKWPTVNILLELGADPNPTHSKMVAPPALDCFANPRTGLLCRLRWRQETAGRNETHACNHAWLLVPIALRPVPCPALPLQLETTDLSSKGFGVWG